MKSLIRKTLRRLGYEIRRASAAADVPTAPIATLAGVRDWEQFDSATGGIPNMLSRQTAFSLYLLCYLQELRGDVVEIGSWQGYSTAHLARAVRDSGNGTLFAIDHFKGNAGKEQFYVVERPDLSDLRQGFENNLRRLDLWDGIRLLEMPNEEAVRHLEGVKLRLLFIDGDHSRIGVEKDIALFFPLLLPGGLVVFDDFSPEFSGLVDAVGEFVGRQRLQRALSYRNTLILRK